MDRFISEIIGFLLTVVMMVGLFLTGLLWYNINQYNSFKNQAQQVVERTGGLSSSAQASLDKLSRTYYHGHFQVWPAGDWAHSINMKASDADTQIQNVSHIDSHNRNRSVYYGRPSEFNIYSDIPLSLAPHGNNDIMMKHNGTGFFGTNALKATNSVSVISQVRKNSQQNVDLSQHGYDRSFTHTNCDVGHETQDSSQQDSNEQDQQTNNNSCNNDQRTMQSNPSNTVKNHKGTTVITPHND